MAKLVERLLPIPEVRGSNPVKEAGNGPLKKATYVCDIGLTSIYVFNST